MEIHITPQTIKQPDLIILSLKINIHKINFGSDATFYVELFAEGEDYGRPIIKYIKIEGDEYLNWKDDDNYIINLICQKLNLKLK